MQIGVNPVGGVVFMQYVTSPATSAANVWNKKPALDELPALRRLSDIMWGAWNRDNGAINKIKYFWVQGVGNTNSKAVIARALKEAGKSLEKWPGTTLDMSEDGALAILGMDDSLSAEQSFILVLFVKALRIHDGSKYIYELFD